MSCKGHCVISEPTRWWLDALALDMEQERGGEDGGDEASAAEGVDGGLVEEQVASSGGSEKEERGLRCGL